ncbi:cytochrome c oxidase assembly protein subunit 15 [Candidatus Nanopelagicus hibericus]|jgi:cytochrome c oxidase assembly protein subunit 15|uniref:Cytochrome c oxidase assembly protein subunit 15 n=1 Tax=Candidatus Nanopelagicus hibericus TaxID=1884915 RepID=A0A249K9G7_9ACTN|nr:COX15/CtaA family protein [Candidatus Nanopelagicus hibericus]ASY13386.1 cytochrome c oxidase assembly protein subunit 15 [Candidatus Nanopelagicus hibericus]
MLAVKGSITARIYTLLVFLQGALIVTGGAVRVTGSGLGCPTWPECTPGSYTPVPNQAEGQLHAWIEFGNRLLTFVLLVTALAVFIISVRATKLAPAKNRTRFLALLQILGILGQGVLGGITVLTDLHPLPVAGHLILSIFLVSGAISLRNEVIGIEKEIPSGLIKFLLPIYIWLTLAVIIIGTIVTGSGPHAGDEQAQRFGIDARVISWLHADFVIALLILSALMYLIATQNGLKLLSRRIGFFLLIATGQGSIGYIQYFTGLPEVLVAAHLLGATLVWGSAWSLIKMANSGYRLQRLTS